MNILFLALILLAFLTTASQQLLGLADAGAMDVLTQSIFQSSEDAITLALGLIGVMAFFLGLMKVAEEAGLMRSLASLISPLMRRLFPEIPEGHAAHSSMVMNISGNMLGLGNAATPFGIQAMRDLDTLNPQKGVATYAMMMFLAINTSSVTLIPTKVIAIRSAAGSLDPAGVILTTLFATMISTLVAISICLVLQRLAGITYQSGSAKTPLKSYIFLGMFMSLIPLTLLYGQSFTPWIIPLMTVGILVTGLCKKVAIYESFTEGAKEGFNVAVKIMPYLVAILVAVGMLKASGAMNSMVNFISPLTSWIGIPGEAIPMILMRPLSGSGSLGILSATLNDPNIGPDSYIGYLVSTLMGCTETTFYVLAVYFGAVQIKKIRHALWIGLVADLAGVLGSVFAVKMILGLPS